MCQCSRPACFRNKPNRKWIRKSDGRSCRLRAMDQNAVLTGLQQLEIETPSWGFGNSGTRFHVYPWPGAARTVRERIADAALVHRLTGCCPRVALHIPWDAVDDYGELRAYAESLGVGIGAINPNLFGDDSYRLGSLCHPDPVVRAARARPLPRVHRHRGGGRLRRDQPLARRRHELPGPGRPARTARAAARGARGDLRSAPAGHAAARRVQVLRAGLLQHRPPRLGNVGARLSSPRRAGAGARRHGPPSAGNERRADRGAVARGEPARWVPLQQPQVRGRRPDRRLDRPVRAVPDHVRDRARGRRDADRVHDRPVAQHRGQDRRDAPVGDEHPDGVREGAARRRGAVAAQPRPTETCSARTGCCSRRSRPTSARSSRRSATTSVVGADPVAAFREAATRKRSHASAARPPPRAPTSSSDRGAVRVALFITCVGDTVFPRSGARRCRCSRRSGTRSCSPASRPAAARCT